MCSNTFNYLSTTSAIGGKWIVLLFVIFSLASQLQPVTGNEVPNGGFKSSDYDILPDMDSNQQQPENYHLGSINGTNATEPNSSNRSFLDTYHSLLITAIASLTLILLFVAKTHVETKRALLPLEEMVVELKRDLCKMTTAFENQQEELDEFKRMYDDSKVIIQRQEIELRRAKQVNDTNQGLIGKLERALLQAAEVNKEVENLLITTMKERDSATKENMLLLDKYNEVVNKVHPTHREWRQTLFLANNGIIIPENEPLTFVSGCGDFRNSVANSQSQTQPDVKAKTRFPKLSKLWGRNPKNEKPRPLKEESPPSSESDDRFSSEPSEMLDEPETSLPKIQVSTTEKLKWPSASDADGIPLKTPKTLALRKTSPLQKKRRFFKRY